MADAPDWLRARGLSREKFAGYLSQYLGGLGFTIERSDRPEPPESVLTARLERFNPAVPKAASQLRFRFVPTANGCAAAWLEPTTVPPGERGPMDRLVREIEAHLRRTVLTESHATAKVQDAPVVRLPWQGNHAPR